MSTVLRVKRRAEETPQEALVLLSKRLKTDATHTEKDSDLTLNVFVFSGTVSDKENFSTHLKSTFSKKNNRLNELKPTKNAEDILKEIREEQKRISQASRYEILNLSRGLKENNDKDSDYAVVDVAKTCTKEEQGVEYAYDLYFSQKKDFDVSTLDDVIRIEDLETELTFGSHRDNGRRTPSDRSSVSSDDSNDENNWRNEYPDTEASSIEEEDMRKAMEDIDIGHDLSSDADEEEIYNDPTIDLNDLSKDDVQRYGLAYAKYKSKVLSTTNVEVQNDDNTDIEDKNSSINNVVTTSKTIDSKSNFVFCSKADDSDESSDGYKDEDDGFYYGMEEDSEQFASQYRQEESDDDFLD